MQVKSISKTNQTNLFDKKNDIQNTDTNEDLERKKQLFTQLLQERNQIRDSSSIGNSNDRNNTVSEVQATQNTDGTEGPKRGSSQTIAAKDNQISQVQQEIAQLEQQQKTQNDNRINT